MAGAHGWQGATAEQLTLGTAVGARPAQVAQAAAALDARLGITVALRGFALLGRITCMPPPPLLPPVES